MDIKGMGIAEATLGVVNCLEGFDVMDGRRVGNTTRLVGRCIDIIFSGKTVLVCDHDLRGTNRRMNEYLFELVRNRLTIEHRLDLDMVRFDKRNLAIYLYKDLDEKKIVFKK